MRKSLSLRTALLALMVIRMAVTRVLSGYSLAEDGGGKVRGLDSTVMGRMDIPEELRNIITGKKAQPFKLTCSDNENLYIVVGYGPQNTGGYNIAVEELYLTDNSTMIDTELIGPAKGENPTTETSHPYVVVKTKYLENLVAFQ